MNNYPPQTARGLRALAIQKLVSAATSLADWPANVQLAAAQTILQAAFELASEQVAES